MIRIWVCALFALLISGVEVKAVSRKEKNPKDGDSGWTIRQLDGNKLVWYRFHGEKFGAKQFVNVLALDLNCRDYELDFVALEKADSLSSVEISHDAVVGINGTYEWDADNYKPVGAVFV